MKNETFLVIGGAGKTGRHIVEGLQQKGLAVRVGSRSSEIPFDWRNRDGWAEALKGVGAVYISYQPDLAAPGSLEDIRTLAELAASAGVERLVLLSGRGEEDAAASEEALKEAGIDWTVLRASWFFQNFSEGFLADMVAARDVVLPVDAVLEPFIDTRDIADVAIAALTGIGHAGQTYDLTGPRLMRFRDATAELSAASGLLIRYNTIDIDSFRGMLEGDGVPADHIWLVTYLFTHVLDGRNESLTSDVERVLGRPARDFSHYAREVAASDLWKA